MNEQDIIAKLVRWQQRRFPLVEGRLNINAYTLLRAFNRYGVSRAAAERYIVGVLGHHCDLKALRQLVTNAYQHTDEHGTKVFDEQSRTSPTPRPSTPRFTLSPSQLARLAQWRQQDQQLRSAPRPVLPPPPSVTSTPVPVQGVTSSTAVTTPEPVTTSTDCKEQARATPEATIAPPPSPRRVIVMRTERGRTQYLVAIVRDPVLRLTFETGNRGGALLMREREALETLNEYRTGDRSAPPCSLVYL